MEIVRLPLSKLEANIGQIPDLPMNPRQWTQDDIESLAKSLAETPELFEARPLLVVPHEGKYVILGGNLRFEACRKNKDKEAPCIVFPEDTTVEKLKEIVVKDNGTFGAWDWDALANEWDDLPLTEWGVPTWKNQQGDTDIDGLFDPDLATPKEKPLQVTVEIPLEMSDKEDDIKAAIRITLEDFPGCKVL